jgi:hypothetical protein
LEGSGHGLILQYYPRLEKLRKTKNFAGFWSAGQDLNSGPPEYEAGVLIT